MAYKNPIPSVDAKGKANIEIKEKTTEESYENDYKKKQIVYFAFIDVLGFKKTFDDNRENDDDQFADKYRNVFNYYFELLNAAEFMKNEESYIGQTSDSLYFYTTRVDILIEFLKLFTHFNLYAMAQNVFFRGGIAKGSLFIKENWQFYGDSVIYAYLIESSISKFPIIVVDEKTTEDITKEIMEKELLDKLIAKKTRHYIKPFAFLENEFKLAIDKNFKLKEIDKEKITKNIKDNLELFEYDVRNYEKYTFLCEELEKMGNARIPLEKSDIHKEEEK